ncbi:hypothetical protein LguiB_009379 [Lonicera macranthoides]
MPLKLLISNPNVKKRSKLLLTHIYDIRLRMTMSVYGIQRPLDSILVPFFKNGLAIAILTRYRPILSNWWHIQPKCALQIVSESSRDERIASFPHFCAWNPRMMPARDLIPWTTMITCYSQKKMYREAFVVFNEMKDNGISPDEMTTETVISAYAHLRVLDLGKEIHLYVP